MDSQVDRHLRGFFAFRDSDPPAVKRLRETLGELTARVAGGSAPEVPSLIAAAEDVVSLVGGFRQLEMDDAASVLMLNAFGERSDARVFSLEDHLLNVAVLTSHLCLERFGYEERLMKLTLAALVHDVGMVHLPGRLFTETGPLAVDDVRLLRQHPEKSAAIVNSWGEPFESIIAILAQEHERADGSGHPQGLKGDAICLEARIIGLVDTYESMTHFRPFRESRCPHSVMRFLIGSADGLFGKDVRGLLVRRFSMYPLGTMVELSTMERGVVVELNHDEPLRPHVLVARGRTGWRTHKPRVLNLKENKLINIVRPLSTLGSDDPVVMAREVGV